MTSSISSADVSSAKPGDHRRRRDDFALLTFVLVFVLCNSAIVYLGVHYNVLLFFIGALAALLLTGRQHLVLYDRRGSQRCVATLRHL